MQQLSFLPENTRKIINVASVKQRSPFRYPGGKTWLVPRIRRWLLSLPEFPAEFFEVFAGGAIVGLTVAAEKLAAHVTLVELDEQVAAVWQTILGDEGEWLAEAIVTFDFNIENVERVLSYDSASQRERAFATILKNRVNHGGILAPGAGRIRTGEGSRGMRSRWYPETLSQRILNIAAIRDRLSFIHGDGMQVLREHANDTDAVFFIDPPYTVAGKRAGARLYSYHELDHEALFSIAETLRGDFLMTYDNCHSVRRLALQHGFDMEPIAMKNTHHAEMTELLIGKNLDWLR
ncbi:MAG: DNA adenine methylase [Anaerolineae bacterium]